MALWLNLGEIFRVNAVKCPQNIAFCDQGRRFTFPQSNRRINQLAHALLAMGLQKGDTVSCFLENCIEICELYIACAKIGVIINPINFRLVAPEVEYIANNADAKAIFVHDEFAPVVEQIRDKLTKVKEFIVVGSPRDGYREYEDLLGSQPQDEPRASAKPADPWLLLYTSGTTGRP